MPTIKADNDMIKRIFVNLATNGIQAMGEKGVIMKVSTKKTEDFIEVKFEDTGMGIKKENLKKILFHSLQRKPREWAWVCQSAKSLLIFMRATLK